MSYNDAGGSVEETRLRVESLRRELKHLEQCSTLPVHEEKLDTSDWVAIKHPSMAQASSLALKRATVAAGKTSSKPNKGRRKRSKRRALTSEVSTYAFSVGVNSAPRIVKAVLRWAYTLTASAGGVVADVIGNGASSASGWAGWAANYENYRVLRTVVELQPYAKYDQSAATSSSPLIVCNDYNSVTALGSYAAGVEYEKITWASTNDQFRHELVCPAVTPYEDWLATSSPANRAYIKLYADSLGVSQKVGILLVLFEVEFMGQA